MLLDQNRAFQSAFALLLPIRQRLNALPLLRLLRILLFLDADEHLREEVALQLLPLLPVLAYSDGAVQP